MELALLHSLELGGKRSARLEKAAAEQEAARAKLRREQEQVALKVVSALYRLRQLKAEAGIVDEALRTFSRIKRQLKSRPRLAPEQQVSLSVFGLAESDYKLRRAALAAEEQSLLNAIRLSIGRSFNPEPALLPAPKESWPVFPDAAPPPAAAAALLAEAELKSAQADLALARGAAWPDVRLGPSAERETQGSTARETYGLGLSLPLPLYQRNKGGREQARRGEASAETALEAARQTLQTEWDTELGRYRAAIAALADTEAPEDLAKSHEGVEDFFQRGLVPSSLVIEAHRQMLEFTKSRNERELAAIRSLWRLYALQGRLLQERL